jgi:HMG (high mobility group) box
MLFSQDARASVLADHPGIAAKDVMSKLGEMWRNLSDAEKKVSTSRQIIPASWTPEEVSEFSCLILSLSFFVLTCCCSCLQPYEDRAAEAKAEYTAAGHGGKGSGKKKAAKADGGEKAKRGPNPYMIFSVSL